MTDDGRTPDGRAGADREDDARTPDEKAMAALFASLVEGSPGSQLSPLEVVRLGKIEVRGGLDNRVRRLKIVRNLLVAAALVAAVVLVLPRIGGSSENTATASSSSSSSSSAAAAPGAASETAGGFAAAASSDASSAGSSAASSAPAGSSAAASEPASSAAAGSSGSRVPDKTAAASSATAGVASGPASSGAPGDQTSAAQTSGGPPSAAPTSGAGSPGPVVPPSPLSTVPDSGGTGECVELSAAAIKSARSAFPAGWFGTPKAPTGCTSSGVVLPSAADAASSVTLNVRKAKLGACLLPDAGAPCSKTASPDVYALTSFGSDSDIWVYGSGYEVYLLVDGDFPEKVTTDQLIAAGRAVIKALG